MKTEKSESVEMVKGRQYS